jgi:secreted PhoX family phosphatase
MGKLGRRDFLRAAVATTGGVVVSGAFEGLLASAAGAAPPSSTLAAVPDLRDGAVRLWLPSGFQYRSFHDTEFMITLDDGTALPGRHDGMAAFAGPGGNVWLVRNHEVNNPGTPFGPGTPYDSAGRGGTTTTLVTPFGEVVQGFTSLNGTQMNCAGGRMPVPAQLAAKPERARCWSDFTGA